MLALRARNAPVPRLPSYDWCAVPTPAAAESSSSMEAEGPKPIMGQPWWGGLHSFLSPPWIYVTLALLRTVLVG